MCVYFTETYFYLRERVMWEDSKIWLAVLLGGKSKQREARKLNIDELAREAESRFARSVEQIAVDVPRCGARADDQKALSRILSAWTLLNRGIGYYQGLNLLASALYSALRESSPHPENDTLAVLGTICRVHASFVPMHAQDDAPVANALAFARKIVREVASANASLAPRLSHLVFDLQVFALRVLPVCFATFFDNAETLQTFWGYIFEAQPGASDEAVIARAAARSRHMLSSLILHNSKLWKCGNDQKQNFCIFEATVSLMSPKQARRVVRAAAHLETLERLGGFAM